MCAKAILSSKGQLVIPKMFRNKLGLHSGSELILELKEDHILEITHNKKNITSFFGMGKGTSSVIEEVDDVIARAVIENDRS
jgi:AbrB family looped-hinge helix DNA binding protein